MQQSTGFFRVQIYRFSKELNAREDVLSVLRQGFRCGVVQIDEKFIAAIALRAGPP